jgi:hypothetical protein
MTNTSVLAACWARNPRGRAVAHLVAGDDDTSLCGVRRGDPAPIVTCRSCLYRWATVTLEGRRTARAGAAQAVADRVAAIIALPTAEAVWEDAARRFERPGSQP